MFRNPLRTEYEKARADAQEAWKALNDFRTEHGEEKIAKDAALFREAKRLHDAYEEACKVAHAAEGRMLDAILDGKTATMSPSEAGRDGMHSVGEAFLKGMGVDGLGLKAIDGTTGGTMVGPFYDDRIRNLPQRQLFVRSLIPVVQADSDKVWYLRQTVATQNAAPVDAGALKPTSVYTIERVETPVVTIAHLTEPLDRALLMDFEQLTSFLDTQLRLGVLLAEEDQILNGDGVGVDFTGILNTAGIQTQARGTDAQVDAIYKAVTKVRLQFMEVDGIVLHPSDWETVRLSKDANGNYLSGTVLQADPDRLFGIEVRTSPVIAQGTGLVGAFSRNQVVFRGEERVTFGVIRPAAFCSVTGL